MQIHEMEKQKLSENVIVANNTLKIQALLIPGATYIILWLLNAYSNGFFILLISLNLTFMAILYLEMSRPNISQILKAILIGSVASMVFISFPKYFVFSICANFTVVSYGVGEVPWNKLHYLFGSNIFTWILAYWYYFTYAAASEPDMKMALEVMGNETVIYQILLNFVISYVLSGTIGVSKLTELMMKEAYESKLIHLNSTLETTNSKIQSSNKELQDALQEKENFILRFSHEIRNPLNSLLGNIELCYEQTTHNKELNTMLHDAKISGEILLQLLNNILDTAKVSAGRLELTINAQHIRNFLERSWIICSEIIRKKRLYGCLSVNVDVPEFLEFDHHRLMQIMMNTISNASKFTETGHVKIFVDFIVGTEIKNEEMASRYLPLSHADSDQNSEGADSDEINEKPRSVREYLTLSNKQFNLSRYDFLDYKDMELVGSVRGSILEKNEQEIFSNKKTERLSSKRSPNRGAGAGSVSGRIPSDNEEGYLRFEIIDSGCGILKEEIESAFGKFQQVNSSTSKRQIGTGLGLWITREIIEMMRGKIEIYSKPNKGTAVVIMIKSKSLSRPPSILGASGRHSRDNKEEEEEEKKHHLEAGKPHSDEKHPQRSQTIKLSTASRMRILVVEDIPYNQEINKKFLQKSGVEDITIATNGQEAVDIFLSKSGSSYFDLILMDIDMPILDGKGAVKLMRQEENERNWTPVRIVFLTGFSEAKTQHELLDKGGDYRANGFYSKPASFETFQQIIKGASNSSVSFHSQTSPKRSQEILAFDKRSPNNGAKTLQKEEFDEMLMKIKNQ